VYKHASKFAQRLREKPEVPQFNRGAGRKRKLQIKLGWARQARLYVVSLKGK
jgi:hypothetical protein